MHKRMKRILYIALSLLGLLIVFYPGISDRWNQYRLSRLMADYSAQAGAVDAAARDEMFATARAYNAGLIGTKVPDAFIDGGKRDPDPEYDALLNVDGSGIMGEVEIPCIGQRIPVYHYTDEETLEKGAGHLKGSSLPVGGTGSHAVISAHRGLPSKKLFTDLDRVVQGNQFYLYILGETLAYEVDQIKVVEPTDTEDLSIDAEKDYCTLLTCTPYAVNTHRLLVRGHRIPYSTEAYEDESAHHAAPRASSVGKRVGCVILGLGIAALFSAAEERVREHRRRQKDGRATDKGKENPA